MTQPKPRHLIAATPTLAAADRVVGTRRAQAWLREAERHSERAMGQASETRIKIASQVDAWERKIGNG
jgi:hypothetical protein